ncbi:Uncharacterized protein SHERM_06478 [Striga hermonthica]|uniref:O-fucosyltransferase family protein n=1 Tax=Striga hermonthica TaxID=68872 RepID=A0A9N7NZJ6_STRHE|nr:Uncharacterized protein SHERM_06478 [Striga hermonthica]
MRRLAHRHQLKQSGVKGMFGRLSVAIVILVICTVSLLSTIKSTSGPLPQSQIDVDALWDTAPSGGWRPSSDPRSEWPPPPTKTNGYLRVRCNGGLNQQRSAICNAVLAARIMNATLVLPELDANSFWHDDSGFHGVYDVEHFIKSLRYDVNIVESIPEIHKNGKPKKIKPFQMRPPRDAPVSWYTTDALKKMKEHGAIYLTPFSHRLAEEIDNPEYQRLRCRVNYHALRFKPHIMELSDAIVKRLRAQGHFMAIHLRFEMDMLAFAGCFDIFTPAEQKILKKYREENFAPKKLVYDERRAIGKCPLTPEEVGLILRALGFDNSTRIYLAAGELFGGDRFMKPFRALFPRLENHNTVDSTGELAKNTNGLMGSAVDYMVCLLADIFMPTYDGPSNFANNLLGHRLYYGFRTNIRPDRKALAPVFIDREKGRTAGFEDAVRRVMQKTNFGKPHRRVSPESFYTNSWPECFCQMSAANPADKCPPDNVVEILETQVNFIEAQSLSPTRTKNPPPLIGINTSSSPISPTSPPLFKIRPATAQLRRATVVQAPVTLTPASSTPTALHLSGELPTVTAPNCRHSLHGELATTPVLAEKAQLSSRRPCNSSLPGVPHQLSSRRPHSSANQSSPSAAASISGDPNSSVDHLCPRFPVPAPTSSSHAPPASVPVGSNHRPHPARSRVCPAPSRQAPNVGEAYCSSDPQLQFQ